MSEVKRAKLISFGSERVNNKNTKEFGKTVRIRVNLPESTEDKCPEFNYKDLLNATKKKPIPKALPPPPDKPTNGLDPFNEDDEDVRRIAAEMEAKYGMGVAKKRKWRKDDYADIGMGYDESDSFIDNTDGYDEIIPRNVTTLHGGFYINCGALVFKTDDDASSDESSSSEDSPEKTNAGRKRIIESSAESDEEDGQTDKQTKDKHLEKKQKLVTSANGMQKAIKKRLFSHEKIKQIRQKRADDTKKTVRELLRERREDLNMTVSSDLGSPEKTAELASSPKDKKPLASVDDVIESVISSVAKKKDDHHHLPHHTDESSKDSVSSKDGANHKSAINSSEAESNDDVQTKPVEIVQLPENLPSDIIGIIESIKNAARCSTEGKVKFFSGEVNTMLLNLERKCRCLGKQSRMKVYEHLAPFVKCRKETLMKRAKNLIAVEEQKKIKVLLDRLKAAVVSVMPLLISNYEAECKGVLQKKFSTQVDESTKSLRMPKRIFSWNEEMRKLVKDIITLKKKCFLNEGKQKESLERHLTEFIKSDVHTIWPEGWMSMNTLLKYCSFSPDIKKNVDNNVKKPLPTQTPSEISISPSSNIITPPNISISGSSSLTITPVTTNVHKVSNNHEMKAKPKTINLSETTISKINNDNSNISKLTKTLPAVDIVKTSPPEINNVKYPTCVNNSNRENKPLYLKEELEAILIDDSPVKKDEPENLSATHVNVIKRDNRETENSKNHCQIIDLTDPSDVKKKPPLNPLKPKHKYTFEFSDKPPKLKKESTEHIRVKTKEEISGTSALNHIITETLSDTNRFAQTSKSLNSTVCNSNNTASINNPIESAKKTPVSSSYDFSKSKSSIEGDDIQKVMEGLKVLHKMSSPVKSNEEIKRSSPVSVIAFNKSYNQDNSQSSHSSNTPTPPHRTTSFQDAFQKQFIPDYHLMRASQANSPPKGSHNSISKHNHMSTKITTSSDRYVQNSNNNYAQSNSNKLKSNCSSQPSGTSYNLLDDMYANFLNEYGYSKPANSKPSNQHK